MLHIATTFLQGLALSSLYNGLVQASPTGKPLYPRNGTTGTAASGYKSVLYFADWDIYQRNFQPKDLPADQLTHVMYAFADVQANGTVKFADSYGDTEKHFDGDTWAESGNNVFGCMKQLYLLKKKHRKLKTLLSIGGWSYREHFAEPMSSDAGRQEFVNSAVTILKNMGFDGLDIDWEYPGDASQAQDMVDLLKTTRDALTKYSNSRPDKPQFLLTLAAPAGPQNFSVLDVAKMDPYLDFWNLMSYDYAGSFNTTATGHTANLYASKDNPMSTPFNTDDAIQFYLKNGVAPEKLIMGMPLYGRDFLQTKGPGQPFNGVSNGSWPDPSTGGPTGVWDYKVLPQGNATVHFDENIVASWSYDPVKQIMVSYDSPQAAAAKVKYIQKQKLGGAMWWEAAGDRPENSTKSLVCDTVHKMGRLETTQNVLNYPDSCYDNMRKGMP